VARPTVHGPRGAGVGIRRALLTDVSRIMEIRHSVRENRLSDPSLVTAADCADFIERSEIWVWEEDGAIQAFAAGDTRDGWIWALFVAPHYEGRGIGQALLPLACATLQKAGYTAATLSTVEGTRADRFYRTEPLDGDWQKQKGRASLSEAALRTSSRTRAGTISLTKNRRNR
jgi:GNAT superfamily N-acetyltransferase